MVFVGGEDLACPVKSGVLASSGVFDLTEKVKATKLNQSQPQPKQGDIMDFKNAFHDTPAETGFALIDEGTYEAELMDCQIDLTKTPARLSMTCAILNHEQFQGRKLFLNYNLEGRGLGFLKKDLDTLGLDYSQVSSEEDIATLVWDVMPVPVMVYVTQKEWQGKTYNNTYLNEVIDRPAALEKAPAKTETRNQTSRTQAGATKPATQTKPNGNGKAAPKNHAPQATTKRPPTKAPAGQPDFEQDSADEIPF